MRSLVLEKAASDLLANITVGRIKGVAYDTAWAARPLTGSKPEFPGALRWLLRNQMWDGSWGSEIDYKHDRALSTTAAVIALHLNGEERYHGRIERGLEYLWDNIGALDNDPYETIGSELLLPSLLREADELGMSVPTVPTSILRKRERKLGLIPEGMIYSKETTLAYSLEFLGEMVDKEALKACISPNGSLGCSPSATMFFLGQTRSARAKGYLYWVFQNMGSTGFPSQLPFETFEYSWSLYNLMKAGWRDLDGLGAVAKRLNSIWSLRENGVSWGKDFPICDSDTTAVTFKVLRDTGYHPDPSVFDRYEVDDGFLCSEFEMNPSISAHVHILEAIKDHPRREMENKDETMDKLQRFLINNITEGDYWKDKWHASPYYTTGHALMALSSVDPSAVQGPLDWLVNSQSEDGGWGFYGKSTVEETAYAMQGLIEYCTMVEGLDPDLIKKGARFIRSRLNEGFERLWIAKGLYCPLNVVLGATISALRLSDRMKAASTDPRSWIVLEGEDLIDISSGGV